MEERRVPQNRDYAHFIIPDSIEDLLRPMPKAYAGAHANSGFHRVVRRTGSKRVTANIARNHHILPLAELIEEAAVRTAGAERWRAWDDSRSDLIVHRVFLAIDYRADRLRLHFAVSRKDVFPITGNAQRAHMLFDVRVVFFHDVDFFHLRSKLANQTVRQRIRETQLQVRRAIAKNLPRVEVAIAGADDTNTWFTHLDAIPLAVIRIDL